jgi:DNA-binding MarR family transcriptional regulator
LVLQNTSGDIIVLTKQQSESTGAPKFLIAPKTLRQFLSDFPDGGLAIGIQLFKGMRILAQRLNDASTARLLQHGLSSTQFSYLAVLYARRHGGISAGELATAVGTTTGAVTTMIGALESEGLVLRRQHPTDGRSVVLSLSPRGKKIYIQAAKTHYSYVGALVSHIGDNEAQKLLDLLIELESALESVNVDNAPRGRSTRQNGSVARRPNLRSASER